MAELEAGALVEVDEVGLPLMRRGCHQATAVGTSHALSEVVGEDRAIC